MVVGEHKPNIHLMSMTTVIKSQYRTSPTGYSVNMSKVNLLSARIHKEIYKYKPNRLKEDKKWQKASHT